MKCFECEEEYVKLKEEYHTLIEQLHVVVPDVDVLYCPNCGDKIIGNETNNKIDKAVQEYIINKP